MNLELEYRSNLGTRLISDIDYAYMYYKYRPGYSSVTNKVFYTLINI